MQRGRLAILLWSAWQGLLPYALLMLTFSLQAETQESTRQSPKGDLGYKKVRTCWKKALFIMRNGIRRL